MNKLLSTILFVFLISGFSTSIKAQEMEYYWAKQYGNDDYPNDIESITSDNLNNIIAFSHFDTEFTIEGNNYIAEDGSDLILFAVDEHGNFEWSMAGGGIDDQVAQEVHCDVEGNIYIMGKFKSQISLGGQEELSNGTFDMFIAKYQSNGDFVWLKTFGGPNSESIETMKIKNDVILIGGRFYDYTILDNDTLFSQDGTDIFIAKMNLDGEFTNVMTAGGASVDKVSGVDMDISGNVYAVGDFYQNIVFGDETFEAGDALGLYMIRLNSNLELNWAYQFEGNDMRPNTKLAVSSDGSITVGGVFSSSVSIGEEDYITEDFDEDIFVANFTNTGEVNWSRHYFSHSMEGIESLKVDRVGNTYITGHYLDHINFGEISLTYNLCCGYLEVYFVKINENGEVVDASQLTGETARIKTMTVPETNQVILAGRFYDDFTIEDITMNSPVSFNVYLAYFKDDTWLSFDDSVNEGQINVFPSPFKEYFNISGLKDAQQILIHNEYGQLVESLEVNSFQKQLGENWGSGIYFMTITYESGFSNLQKVIKM